MRRGGESQVNRLRMLSVVVITEEENNSEAAAAFKKRIVVRPSNSLFI